MQEIYYVRRPPSTPAERLTDFNEACERLEATADRLRRHFTDPETDRDYVERRAALAERLHELEAEIEGE